MFFPRNDELGPVRRVSIMGIILLSSYLSARWYPLLEHNLNSLRATKDLQARTDYTPLSVMPNAADPLRARTFSWLAMLAIQRDDLSQARFFTERVISIPNAPERALGVHSISAAMLRRAKELESDGQLDQAEHLYRYAVLLDPTNPTPHDALANFLEFYRHDLSGAATELEFSVHLHPTPQSMVALAARYRYTFRFVEASALLLRVQQDYPSYVDQVLVESGWLELDQKNFWGAIAILERARDQFPRSANVWYTLAVAYERAGRFDESLDSVDKAIALDRRLTSAYLQAAGVSVQRDELERAKDYLDQLLALDIPADRTRVLGLVSLGNLYMRTGRINLARQSFCEAKAINRWGLTSDLIDQRIKDLNGCH